MGESGDIYNPLERRRLAESVASALLQRSIVPLPPSQFNGAGVYALYYTGDLEAYQPISHANAGGRWEAPIYVGQAIPAGSRRGSPTPEAPPGRPLFNRLSQHHRSIEQATNLESSAFHCRYLVVDDIWIPLAESLLITMFRRSLVWNTVLDGFGIHDPGRGRRSQKKSAWDTVHPGRPFAEDLSPPDHDSNWWLATVKAHLTTEFHGPQQSTSPVQPEAGASNPS